MKAKLRSFWKKRQPRERLIIVGAAFVSLLALSDRAVLAPLRTEARGLRAELASTTATLQQLQMAADAQALQGQTVGQARIDALAVRRQAAEAIIAQAQTDLVSPQQMQRELAVILERFPQIHVVGMKTLAPVPIVGKTDGSAPAGSGAPRTPSADNAAPAAGLYQHGLEITVEGHYLDLIAYLDTLSKAPYRIYWRDLNLTVDAHRGIAQTRIRIFTLSREPTWLSL
jgi:MSHA biogenesis protein MshJ